MSGEEQRTLSYYFIPTAQLDRLKDFTEAVQKAVPSLFVGPVTYCAVPQTDQDSLILGQDEGTRKINKEKVLAVWDKLMPKITDNQRCFSDPSILLELPKEEMYLPFVVSILFKGSPLKYIEASFLRKNGGYSGELTIGEDGYNAALYLAEGPYQALKKALKEFERKEDL